MYVSISFPILVVQTHNKKTYLNWNTLVSFPYFTFGTFAKIQIKMHAFIYCSAERYLVMHEHMLCMGFSVTVFAPGSKSLCRNKTFQWYG